MKKIALLLGFMIVTSQLPLCPGSLLPSGLGNSLEYGRQWTTMFFQAFGNSPAPQPASSTAENSQPAARVDSEATAVVMDDDYDYEFPDADVQMAAFASIPAPAATPAITFTLPTDALQTEGIPVPPVTVNIPLPADKNVRAKVQKEVECALQKVRIEMQRELRELHRVNQDATAARSSHQRLQNLQKIRLLLKSA